MGTMVRSNATFGVTLDFVGAEPIGLRFRIAFHSSQGRWLLPYPAVTGLRFIPPHGGTAPVSAKGYLVSGPRDEFVLNPDDRIAFDLVARTNVSSEGLHWFFQLQPGDYDVRYVYEVGPNQTRYDYLGKGSRFADMTPPWVGAVESNTVQVTVLPGMDGIGT